MSQKSDEQVLKEAMSNLFDSWIFDPVKFVYEGLGFENRKKDYPNEEPTPQQIKLLRQSGNILRAKIKKHRNEPMTEEEKRLAKKVGISVRSGQGNGKTACAAWLVIWFLICHENGLCPCIAPKAEQLQTTLFKEIAVWVAEMNKYGHILCKDKIEIQSNKIYHKEYSLKKESWAAIPKVASDEANTMEQGVKLRGDHAFWMMVMAEEAAGISEGAGETLEGTLKDTNFMIMIFNPIKNEGYAFESHHSRKQDWICMHWSAEDSVLFSKDNLERAERTYGRDSNYFRVNVLGEFPIQSENEFIPLHLIEEAFNRSVEIDENDGLMLGVDPARFGKDRTALFERRGSVLGPIHTFTKHDNVEVAEQLAKFNREFKTSAIIIDTNGNGSGVYDVAKRFRLPVWSIMSQSSARDHKKFSKLRDELLWGLKEWFMEHKIAFNLRGGSASPERAAQLEIELKEELRTLEYTLLDNGKIKFISKDKIKSKLGRSPDLLDALCLALYFNSEDFRVNRNGMDGDFEDIPPLSPVSYMGV